MKIRDIEWEENAKGVSSVCCPECGKAWKTDDDGEVYPCKHLEFVWGDGGLVSLGDFDQDQLRSDYVKARAKIAADNDDEDLEDGDGIFDEFPDWDVIGELETKVVDELCQLTESGMACGPVSFTTFFGIKHEKKSRRARRQTKA